MPDTIWFAAIWLDDRDTQLLTLNEDVLTVLFILTVFALGVVLSLIVSVSSILMLLTMLPNNLFSIKALPCACAPAPGGADGGRHPLCLPGAAVGGHQGDARRRRGRVTWARDPPAIHPRQSTRPHKLGDGIRHRSRSRRESRAQEDPEKSEDSASASGQQR